MQRRVSMILAAGFVLASAALSQHTPTLSLEQQKMLSAGRRSLSHGWISIHIEGTARQRGFQHGYLLAAEVKDAVRQTKRVWEYQSGLDWQWLVEKSAAMFTTQIDSENLAEIDGIAEGVKAAGYQCDRNEIIALNGSTEFMGYWWPSVKDTISPNAPDPKKESCSSFIATGSMTKSGEIVLGHSTWSSYYYPYSNIVMDIVPERGSHILWQTAAGLIHSGTDFFITSAGIVGSETTIGAFFPFDPKGVPEFVRMRVATQYATSIDEWCGIMRKGNNGGYANAWLIGDTKTNEIARLELGLKYVGFERTKDGCYTGSNIAEDLRILRFETKSNELNIKNPNIARRVRWKQLMKEYRGRITVREGKRFLADHVDTYLKRTEPASRSLCGHMELDAQASGIEEPYYPLGAYDAKVVDAAMARKMTFAARWGAPCGKAFNAKKYLDEHPQFDWMEGLLIDRPTQPWTLVGTRIFPNSNY